jgi:hypothetical protein
VEVDRFPAADFDNWAIEYDGDVLDEICGSLPALIGRRSAIGSLRKVFLPCGWLVCRLHFSKFPNLQGSLGWRLDERTNLFAQRSL